MASLNGSTFFMNVSFGEGQVTMEVGIVLDNTKLSVLYCSHYTGQFAVDS